MQIGNQEVLDNLWFNQMNTHELCAGIVKTRDIITNEIKFYVGFGYGVNPNMDIEKIVRFGLKYSKKGFQDIYKKFLELEN